VTVTSEEEAVDETMRNEQVYASLRDTGPQTVKQLTQALGLRYRMHATNALRKLAEDGRVREDKGVWSTGEPDGWTSASHGSLVRPQGRPAGHSGAAERDFAVLALLKENPAGLTRNAILEALRRKAGGEHTPSRVYWSLKRLRDRDEIRTCAPPKGTGRELVWSVGPACP
jgi:hypothetical protein